MDIWLNGASGAGKTTTATILASLLPNARILDSEGIGHLLRHVLDSAPVGDFQDWPPWRRLVVATAQQVLDYVGGTLVIPQTVLVREHWQEINSGFAHAGVPVRHVVLHATRGELVRRIQADLVESGAKQWRLGHLAAYETARVWLGQDAETVDTTGVQPARIAELIAESTSPGTSVPRNTQARHESES